MGQRAKYKNCTLDSCQGIKEVVREDQKEYISRYLVLWLLEGYNRTL